MRLSVCIIDEDAIRAETIKETLLDEGYKAISYTSFEQGLRAIVEHEYDVIFLDYQAAGNFFASLDKTKSLSPKSEVVALVPSSRSSEVLKLSSLGVKHFIETPFTTISSITEEVAMIEANIMKEENKASLIWQILEDSKALLKGYITPDSQSGKRLSVNIQLASNILSPSVNAPGEIKGNFSEIPFHELIKICLNIYKDGCIQVIAENGKGMVVIKNNAVVYASINDSITGHMAFLRIASWNKATFIFRNSVQVHYFVDQELSNIDQETLYAKAMGTKKWFDAAGNSLPSQDLKININKSLVNFDVNFTPMELDVLSTVTQYKNVGDILNASTLADTDVYEILISLRKKNCLEVIL